MTKFNIPNFSEEFIHNLRQQLQKFASAYKLIQLIVGGIFPIFEGVLASKVSVEEPSKLLITLLVMIGIIHVVFLYLLISSEKPLAQFLVEYDQKVRELEGLQEEIDGTELFSNSFRTALESSSLSLVGIDTHLNDQDSQMEKVFGDVLDPWITARTDIFWFYEGDALYNMAVYLFNSQDDLLEMSFRRCDDRIVPKNRTWGVGLGHIGLCYAKDETVFCKDITKDISTTNVESERQEDRVYYRSIIAEPIRLDEQKIGVFIVTSSQPSQFDEDIHVPCVRIISQLLNLGYRIANHTR